MDGQFYNDLLKPFIITPVAAVTLSTTNKALYPVANIPSMGKDYWYAGKAVRIRAFGQITTGATPGNLTVALNYGTGADNVGVALATSAAQTLVASQTNISWRIDLTTRCISIGSAGTLFTTGEAFFESAVIANRIFLIPASAPAVSAACDLTVASDVLSLQALRSGSTAETMQIVDMQVIALN
jgi:hypothetical protein